MIERKLCDTIPIYVALVMAKAFLDSQVKIDPRKHRSHVKLFDTLSRKYRDGTVFDQIEITEFCQDAGVSRATFYRHHQILSDLVVVQFLIVIAQFERQIDALPQINFETSSAVIVQDIYANSELIKMVRWSGVQTKVQDLLSGSAQQILILRDNANAKQTLVSDFLGSAVLNFAQQITLSPEPISQTEALALYRLLLPNHL